VTIDANAVQGIDVEGGTLSIDSSTIEANASYGVFMVHATTTIMSTTIDQNGDTGLQQSFGALTLSRSTVANNKGGGFVLESDGAFVIVGNVFVGNGLTSGAVGGVSILESTSAGDRLDFNSFSGNHTVGGGHSRDQRSRCDLATFTPRETTS